MGASDYIALGSAAVATLAFLVAVCEGVSNRRHNRLSVRPLISTYCELRGGQLEIGVRNTGLGPARITNVELRDEETGQNYGFDSRERAESLLNLFYTELLPEQVTALGRSIGMAFVSGDSTWVSPGKDLRLIWSRSEVLDSGSDVVLALQDKVLFRFGSTVEFESVYKEVFDTKT